MNDLPEGDPAHDSTDESTDDSTDESTGAETDESPIIGRLIDPQDSGGNTVAAANTTERNAGNGAGDQAGEVIREGSPFAKEPELWDGGPTVTRKPESFYDLGPLRYTALGAVAASIMVLGFASAASFWFPGGGTLIAGLGCALAIFGLYSSYRRLAATCLILHLLLFIFCYSQAITA